MNNIAIFNSYSGTTQSTSGLIVSVIPILLVWNVSRLLPLTHRGEREHDNRFHHVQLSYDVIMLRCGPQGRHIWTYDRSSESHCQIGPQMIPDRLTINIEWNGLKFGQWISTLYTTIFFILITLIVIIKLSACKFHIFKNYNIAAQYNRTIYL